MAHTRSRPKRRFPPEVLRSTEVDALIHACAGDNLSAVRNRALLAVLYRTGLRISEALGLYPKDIDLARSCIRVLNGKGGKAPTVGIDPGGLALLAPWLARRVTDSRSDGHATHSLRLRRRTQSHTLSGGGAEDAPESARIRSHNH